jgi:hypothetical protein
VAVPNYTQVYAAAHASSATLQQRLAAAIVDYAATTVASEGAVANHAQRMVLAQQFVANPDGAASQMILAAVTVLAAAGNTTPTDTDLRTTVGSLWNVFAGVG